ncbi:MAG: lysylphosphatidylglycerol synthase transmembrane domain-containing protein, partial [Bacteroidia bacterium]
MSKQLKSFIQYSVITLIGVFFLYFVFKGVEWKDLVEKFREANYYWIAVGMLVSLFSHYLRGYRAVMLYEALNYKVPVRNSFYAVMIGYMMNYIIPRAGEVSRCAALVKTDDIPVEKSLGTVVTERVFDMVILLLILAMVFFMQFDLLTNYIQKSFNTSGQTTSSGLNLKLIFGIISLTFVVVFFLIRKKLAANPLFKKFMDLLKGFGEGLMSIRNIKNPVKFIFLSIAIWFCYVMMMYFCLFATKATEHLGFMECLTVFVIGAIGIVIPAPGAGAGTYH